MIRKGQKLKTNVTLVAPVEDPPRDARKLAGHHPLSGAKVANLSPAVAQELGLDEEGTGVVVLEVEAQTPAQRLGVQRGDIIVGINNEKSGARWPSSWRCSRPRPAAGGSSLERGGKLFNLAIQG